jgi:hypothetical protein
MPLDEFQQIPRFPFFARKRTADVAKKVSALCQENSNGLE